VLSSTAAAQFHLYKRSSTSTSQHLCLSGFYDSHPNGSEVLCHCRGIFGNTGV
jgi:hypothetical protein